MPIFALYEQSLHEGMPFTQNIAFTFGIEVTCTESCIVFIYGQTNVIFVVEKAKHSIICLFVFFFTLQTVLLKTQHSDSNFLDKQNASCRVLTMQEIMIMPRLQPCNWNSMNITKIVFTENIFGATLSSDENLYVAFVLFLCHSIAFVTILLYQWDGLEKLLDWTTTLIKAMEEAGNDRAYVGEHSTKICGVYLEYVA
ncbi:hypothetical protein ACJX0J_031008 [Zea mays]